MRTASGLGVVQGMKQKSQFPKPRVGWLPNAQLAAWESSEMLSDLTHTGKDLNVDRPVSKAGSAAYQPFCLDELLPIS